MIEANLTRLLRDINVLPCSDQNTGANNFPNQYSRQNPLPAMSNNNNPIIARPQSTQPNPIANFPNLSSNAFSNSHTSQMTFDKATSIIQSWNVRFDGSSS